MNLKELRTRMGLTQKQLADLMTTTQQTVARWETGKTVLNVDQIKDLCIILQCSAAELLGWEEDDDELSSSPFSFTDHGDLYGTLKITMKHAAREYPIDEMAKEALSSQLASGNAGTRRHADGWLAAWTLNNCVLLINPAHLRKVEMISEVVEQPPSYENPEVYRALAEWDVGNVKGKLREECERLMADLSEEEALAIALSTVTIYDDGLEETAELTGRTANNLLKFMNRSSSVSQGLMLEVEEQGHNRSRFVNLDHVAVLEVPADLFHRLTISERS